MSTSFHTSRRYTHRDRVRIRTCFPIQRNNANTLHVRHTDIQLPQLMLIMMHAVNITQAHYELELRFHQIIKQATVVMT